MTMRRRRPNPLLAQPPLPEGRKPHRAGENISRKIAAHLGTSVAEIYEGVHITNRPSAAVVYALAGMQTEGWEGVTRAPVLIGLKRTCGPEEPDVDVFTTAFHLQDEYPRLVDLWEEWIGDTDLNPDSHDFDSLWDEFAEVFDEGLQEMVQEYAADSWFDDYEARDWGVAYILGQLANQGDSESFYGAIRDLLELHHAGGEPDFEEDHLRLAKAVVPQRRVLCDVDESAIAAVVLVPPYSPGQESPRFDEQFAPFYADIDSFHEEVDFDDYDRVVRDEVVTIFGNPQDAVYWHGTDSRVLAQLDLGLPEPAVLETYAEVFDGPETGEDDYDGDD